MSVIQGDQTHFMNQTENVDFFGFGGESNQQAAEVAQRTAHNPQLKFAQQKSAPPAEIAAKLLAEQKLITPAQRHEIATKFDEERKQYATSLI